MELIVSALLLAGLYYYRRRFPAVPAKTPGELAEVELRTSIQREANAKFVLSRHLPHLREYVRVGSQVISETCLHSAPIADYPETDGRPLDYAKRSIRLALDRFGTPLPNILARFSRLEDNRPGCVQKRGDGSWALDFDHSFRDDGEAILSIAAHEVAHVALLSRGIRLEPLRRNEELTDATAVLAGFGPVMLRTTLRDSATHSADRVELQARLLGYLPSGALVWLSTLRVEMAGGDALFYREHVADWQRAGVDSYLRLRDNWRQHAARSRGRSIDCFACAMPVPIPARHAVMRIVCRTCKFPLYVPPEQLPN